MFSSSLSIIPSSERHLYQFSAILGDLLHKQDVYLLFGDFGSGPEAYFSNHSQASFLRTHFPELVPPPGSPDQPPSDHTLGTVFEYHYYTHLGFKLHYLAWLRHDVAAL